MLEEQILLAKGKNWAKLVTERADKLCEIKKDETDFIDCVVFGTKTCEALTKYTEKGNRIIVVGSLQIDSFTNKDGNTKKSVYVIVDDFYFVDFKKELTK